MREAARRKKPVYIHGELSRFPQYEDGKKQADYRHWRRVTGQLDGSPGPGLYEERSSLFEQASSRKPTLPRARGSVHSLTRFTLCPWSDPVHIIEDRQLTRGVFVNVL